MGQNLLEDLVAEEVRLSERIVAIDEEAVLIAPYASCLPFQLMLVPRRPRAALRGRWSNRRRTAARGTEPAGAPPRFQPALNLWVRTAPSGAEHFCWRIDVMPRLTHLAGLELSSGVNLNIVAPEHAAGLLREA